MSVNKKLRDRPAGKFPPIVGQAAAPHVFVDGILGFGAIGGMIQLEVGSTLLVVKPDDSTEVQVACVAHLRFHPRVALNLIKAINDALAYHRDNVMKQRQAQQQKAQQHNKPARKPVPVPAEEEDDEAEAA